MSFWDGVKNIAKVAAPIVGGAIAGPGGAAAGSALAGGISALDSGGKQQAQAPQGTGGGQYGYQQYPYDFFAKYGTEAAAANVPLTLAGLRFTNQSGANIGAMGLYGEGLSSGQKTILADAAKDSSGARQLQMGEVSGMIGAGQRLAEQTGNAKLQLELLNPAFAAQAGSAMLNQDNRLAENLATTNIGLRALQEGAKTNIAQKYADTLGGLLATRASTEGNLALGQQDIQSRLALGQQNVRNALSVGEQSIRGNLASNAQRIAGSLALGDQDIMGDLTRNQAKVKGDIAKIRANAMATDDLRNRSMGRVMAGNAYFG